MCTHMTRLDKETHMAGLDKEIMKIMMNFIGINLVLDSAIRIMKKLTPD